MNKKIANVVFYKFYGEQGEMQQACIFYEDGSVKNTSHEEGIDAAHELAVEQKIKTKNQFTSEMLNRHNIYTLTGEEFERRFQEFRGTGMILRRTPSTSMAVRPVQPTSLVPRNNEIRPTRVPEDHVEPNMARDEEIVVPRQNNNETRENETPRMTNVIPLGPSSIADDAKEEETRRPVGPSLPKEEPVRETPSANTSNNAEEERKNPTVVPIIVPPVGPRVSTSQPAGPNVNIDPVEPVVTPVAASATPAAPTTPTEEQTRQSSNPTVTPIIVPPVGPRVSTSQPIEPNVNNAQQPAATTPTVTPVQAAASNTAGTAPAKEEKPKKKKGLFSRMWAKVTAVVLACALALGGAFALGKNAKDVKLFGNDNTAQMIDDTIEEQDRAYLALIEKSTNEDQKSAMTYMSENLDAFNRDFADNYMEQGKNVRAALTWDEMMALNLAYNTYTKDQIAIMFNGSEVNAELMSQAYKNANLQLMGAYVIADRAHPVNSAAFINNEYERSFVEKYENMFYLCKELEGEQRIQAINNFYQQIYSDFPISDQVREVGISHSDGRQQLEPYKTALIPMVAAMEIMWQNTDGVDHTLSDKAINYFNDLGLCNLIDSKYERAQAITLAAQTDTTQPLYEEFRNAKITELIYEGNYPRTDAERDLSQLDRFQYWVNGHHNVHGNTGKKPTSSTKTTTTTKVEPVTETTTRTETTTKETTDREEAVKAVGEDAVKKAEQQVDQQIAAENQAAKEAAEREAELNRQRLQAQADEETRRLEELIRQDQANLQQTIDTANRIINNGGTVNEKDLGHGVKFDPQHSDGQGNLDRSVKDITTDGTGAVDANTPLPDPNQTGARFDSQQPTSYNSYQGYSAAPAADQQPTWQQPQGTQEVPSGASQIETPSGMEGNIYEFDASLLDGYVEDPNCPGRWIPASQVGAGSKADEGYAPTNEQLVDAYIAELEGNSQETGYQYQR